MNQIEHIDLGNLVYERLKSMILSGELAPGQKILQEHLALRLGVSRTPLLKALQILEKEFLVVSMPRKGMYVNKLSLEDLADAFECRAGLEGVAARLTAMMADPEDINDLYEIFRPFQETGGKISEIEYTKADLVFHKKVIEYSQNDFLRRIELMANIHQATYNRGLIRPPEETLPEHIKIIEALKNRDADKAEQRMLMHLRKSIDRIRTEMKNGDAAAT